MRVLQDRHRYKVRGRSWQQTGARLSLPQMRSPDNLRHVAGSRERRNSVRSADQRGVGGSERFISGTSLRDLSSGNPRASVSISNRRCIALRNSCSPLRRLPGVRQTRVDADDGPQEVLGNNQARGRPLRTTTVGVLAERNSRSAGRGTRVIAPRCGIRTNLLEVQAERCIFRGVLGEPSARSRSDSAMYSAYDVTSTMASTSLVGRMPAAAGSMMKAPVVHPPTKISSSSTGARNLTTDSNSARSDGQAQRDARRAPALRNVVGA